MRKIIFTLFICLLNLPAAALNHNDFPASLQQVLDERTAELKLNEGIFIAGRVTMSDGAHINSGADVMVNLCHNIDEPLWVYEDGWFMMDHNLSSNYAGEKRKLAFRAFGYEPNDVFITILKGEITYVEFVMRKTSPEYLATVEGIVFNDQNEPFDGAIVSLSFPFANHGFRGDTGYTYPHMEITTGPDGQYSFEGLSAAKYSLVAAAPGCAYHSVSFTPIAGEAATQDLKLYKNRCISIDYVYQADGNSTFTEGDLQTGTIEWLNGHDGVDFSDGRVEGYDPQSLRDIEMRQEQDVLKFYIVYCNGQQNGFYDRGDVDFDSVIEVPRGGYLTEVKPCIVGHTYIVRTYENKYAKFVVRSISAGK